MSIFRHVDGRIMKRTAAGGTGGGVTSHFDELATADEAAEFERAEMAVEAGLVEEHEEPAVVVEPEYHVEDEVRPAEAAPNA